MLKDAPHSEIHAHTTRHQRFESCTPSSIRLHARASRLHMQSTTHSQAPPPQHKLPRRRGLGGSCEFGAAARALSGVFECNARQDPSYLLPAGRYQPKIAQNGPILAVLCVISRRTDEALNTVPTRSALGPSAHGVDSEWSAVCVCVVCVICGVVTYAGLHPLCCYRRSPRVVC